jgi:peptidoglycan/LPS O-acetylase OafA/YrhL
MSLRQPDRLAWLDALRGVAALCVVADHGSGLVWWPGQAFASRWLDLGQYGVFVFFLVSGYIIPASLERKGSVRGFWISRAFRLYPLYLFAIAASVVAYRLGYGPLHGAQHHPAGAVASWLLMMPNLLSGPSIPNVTWTLSYEMVFYLLLAALFSVRAHRLSGGYALACGIVVLAVGGMLPMAALEGGHGLLGPGYVDLAADALIIAGIAASMSAPAGGPRRPAVGAWGAALAGMFLLTANQDRYPFPWSGYAILAFMFTGTLVYRAEHGQVRKATAAVVAVAVLAMTTGGGLWQGALHPSLGADTVQWRYQWVTSLAGAGATFGAGLLLRRRRVPRVLGWLGMISYSVYLIHPLVLNAFRDVRPLHDASRAPGVQVPLALGLLAVIVGASAATYYVIERPMQRIGRKVASSWATASGQPPATPARAGEPAAGTAGGGNVMDPATRSHDDVMSELLPPGEGWVPPAGA